MLDEQADKVEVAMETGEMQGSEGVLTLRVLVKPFP